MAILVTSLAGFLFCAVIISGPALASADDAASPAAIDAPLRLPPGPILCDRVALGEPDDYKACIARLPDGELLLKRISPTQARRKQGYGADAALPLAR